MENTSNQQTKLILLGALIGALSGAGAGYLIAQNSKGKADEKALTTSDGLKLGVMLFGFLRQLSQLGR